MDPVFTAALDDWRWHARLAIRPYRPAFARNLADPRGAALVRAITDASADFDHWWGEADISDRDHGRKVLRQQTAQTAVFDYLVLRPPAHDGAEVLVFLPAGEATSVPTPQDGRGAGTSG